MLAKICAFSGGTVAFLSTLTPNPAGICSIATLIAVGGILAWPSSAST